jgi:ABC-type transport system involved in cytochrome c biogenesis ATPase subunit
MLIAFEGQDGAGKTSLLRATYTELTSGTSSWSDSRLAFWRVVERLITLWPN